jgi:hypothetical protein
MSFLAANPASFPDLSPCIVERAIASLSISNGGGELRPSCGRPISFLRSSYKKDDKYISHTEWHRCVVFGKLAQFAKTLTKGAHI